MTAVMYKKCHCIDIYQGLGDEYRYLVYITRGRGHVSTNQSCESTPPSVHCPQIVRLKYQMDKRKRYIDTQVSIQWALAIDCIVCIG